MGKLFRSKMLMFSKKRFYLLCLAPFFLSWLAWIRTDGFSPLSIKGPLTGSLAVSSKQEAVFVLSQPFHYLGKGRQCFIFESKDGRYVLKFFNQRYLQMPWYSFLVHEKEQAKRSLRRSFYEHSYEIAFKEFGEEIVYLHLGTSQDLQKVEIRDKASRVYQLDLNQIPFVLQRKGAAFYPFLQRIYEKEGKEGLFREISTFLEAIHQRISKQIADADADIEHNWGYVDGHLFHLDPGRLYYDDSLPNPERLKREWRIATQGFVKWLQAYCPEAAEYLENSIQTNYIKII